MIVVKIMGGLGNQMFQFACGFALSKQKGQKLVLDISDYKYGSVREYALDSFVLSNDIIIDSSGKYNRLYDKRTNLFIKIFYKLNPYLFTKILQRKGIFIRQRLNYENLWENTTFDNYYLYGYWHSYKYFEEFCPELRKCFSLKNIKSVNNKLIEEVRSDNAVCVHIRRGDFLSKKNSLIPCSNEYYLKSMDLIEKRITSPTYYIFSDDINDVKCTFTFGNRKIKYMDCGMSPAEEMYVMSQCNNFIIANSTFSWWATILNDSKNKLVIVPQKWYEGKRDVSGLILPNYITI